MENLFEEKTKHCETPAYDYATEGVPAVIIYGIIAIYIISQTPGCTGPKE
jgi:hypothetical protein